MQCDSVVTYKVIAYLLNYFLKYLNESVNVCAKATIVKVYEHMIKLRYKYNFIIEI